MQVKPDWNLIYPLSEFYEQSGLSLPSVARVEGQDIPMRRTGACWCMNTT